MPYLGHSGAMILVGPNQTAKSGIGTADQAEYCMELGDTMCPAIYSRNHVADAYSMETLNDLVIEDVDFRALLLAMIGLLQRHVWSKATHCEENWIPTLAKWAEDFDCLPHFREALHALYVEPTGNRHYCLIHGDPTFANVMTRGDDKRIVLIDPIKPTDKIPPLREVDLGKILQSLLGWEHLLVERWPESQVPLISYLLRDVGKLARKRAWFWAAVHCARILPYAHDEKTVRWCEQNAQRSLSLALRL